MTREEIDAIYKNCNRVILRKSLIAGGKAVTVGSEDFNSIIDIIADAYGLDKYERVRLDPELAKAALNRLSQAVPIAKNAKMVKGTVEALNTARKNKKLLDTIGAFASGGLKTAQTVAKGATSGAAKVGRTAAGKAAAQAGKVSSKAGWIGIAINGAIATGTTSAFYWRARSYNRSCHRLLMIKNGHIPANAEPTAEHSYPKVNEPTTPPPASTPH